MGDSCGKDITSEEYPCHRLITSSGYSSAALVDQWQRYFMQRQEAGSRHEQREVEVGDW